MRKLSRLTRDTLMAMQAQTLCRMRWYFLAPKFWPTKVVTDTPKAPETIQMMAPALP